MRLPIDKAVIEHDEVVRTKSSRARNGREVSLSASTIRASQCLLTRFLPSGEYARGGCRLRIAALDQTLGLEGVEIAPIDCAVTPWWRATQGSKPAR